MIFMIQEHRVAKVVVECEIQESRCSRTKNDPDEEHDVDDQNQS